MLYIGFMFTTPLHVNEINIRLNLYSDLLFGCSLDNELLQKGTELKFVI